MVVRHHRSSRAARRIAAAALDAGRVVVVIECRYPSPGQRGHQVVEGWKSFEVHIDGRAVHRFGQYLGRRPIAVNLGPAAGEVTVEAVADSLPLGAALTVGPHCVYIVTFWPALMVLWRRRDATILVERIGPPAASSGG